MAKLTVTQKATLDAKMKEMVDGFVAEDKTYTLKELAEIFTEQLGFNVHFLSIEPSFERCHFDKHVLDHIGTGVKFVKRSYIFKNFVKERDHLIFKSTDDKTNVYYDFTNHQFCHEGLAESEIYCGQSNLNHILEILNDSKEWVLSYLDDLNDFWNVLYALHESKHLPDECPRGLMNYAKEKGRTYIDFTVYRQFEFFAKYGELGERLRMNFCDSDIALIFDTIGYKKYVKICSVSLNKNGYIQWANVNRLLRVVAELTEKNKEFELDTNRDVEYNLNTLENLKNKEFNDKLAEQLQKLNFLNGMTFGDCTVVVPQRIEDLQNEGRQQNNCVGSYYNRYIYEGTYSIYFIRKTNKVDKSYITCRVDNRKNSVGYAKTVENRYVNNNSVNKTSDLEIIKQINEIIRQHYESSNTASNTATAPTRRLDF